MKLLPRDKLTKTGPVDYADWNYRPVLGQIQRIRFALALSLLPAHSKRVLEIGYGSGVFMPSLSRISSEVYGIDVHGEARSVNAALESVGVNAHLTQVRAEDLPFHDQMFDAVTAVSSLEFVSDLDAVCCQITRVLKRSGSFVVVTPGHSALLDFGLKALTGKSAKQDFGDRRERIIPTLLKHFSVERKRVVPPAGGAILSLYVALRLRRSA